MAASKRQVTMPRMSGLGTGLVSGAAGWAMATSPDG